ncbi:hypothetical protein FHP25_36920 [Vineibacter terrae]|uniref:Uncharacterized protein n=1 Tax=Vineibacter terrae TaxID=2586908 RepID=A0A5C8P7Z3_9HYPH|nr:hypothetical protein [Vineibacter terrae]TXL69896.1 hypothetical protein FHP25_36920 [Vineibacter terrae]
MTPDLAVPIRPVGIAYQTIRMSCIGRAELDDVIVAYINGIKVGENYVGGVFNVGAIIEYPIQYLPHVDLPSDIRFARMRDGVEIASPFTLKTQEDAIALVGLGDVRIESLSIEHGVVRGVAINRVNGLLRPEMFAKINGVVPRGVVVDQHRLLDDGGASFQFHVRLEPQDLTENGLAVDVYVVGKDGPLSSIVYRRADPDDGLRRVIQLESRLDQNQQATGYQIQALDNEITARIELLQDRIDAFIEYSASLLFDRVAATTVEQVDGAPALDGDRQRKMQMFLDLVKSGARMRGTVAHERADAAAPHVVPLRSGAFSHGWYDVEVDDGEEYRWMSSEAIVFNPMPERKLVEVQIAVFGIYGAELPMLNCFFDGVPANILRERSATGGPLLLKLQAPKDKAPLSCDMLRIESMVSASPATLEGLSDHRLLSIAVSQIAFSYAE